MKDPQVVLNETKGQKMAGVNLHEIDSISLNSLTNLKQRFADLIDGVELLKTENNIREISITQTHLETAIMYLTKAIINK